MEEELTESEREQLRKFAALQKVALEVVYKWKWWIVGVFAALSVLFAITIVWYYAKSDRRFYATTRLLYTPRKVVRIESLSDKQLFTVIERDSLKRRVGQMLKLDEAECGSLQSDLEIVQERRPSNLFTLTAKSPSWVGAVKKVNAYAKSLTDEYVSYRAHDLGMLRDSINVRRKRLEAQIAEIESEEAIVKGKTGVTSPVEALSTLNSLISDQRRNLSMLNVQIANEEVKRRRLEEGVGKIGPAVAKCAALIRDKSAKLAALDREIAKLREVYTDINPKVIGKIEDREEMMAEYLSLLKERGIEGMTVEDVERVERSAGELAEVVMRRDVLLESQRSLEQEIKGNEAKSAALTEAIPALERLRVRRDGLETTMREIDDQLDDITYLEMTTAGDLRQVERANAAGDSNPLSARNFALAGGGAFACTCAFLFWVLALELTVGKVRGAVEVAAYGDILPLGSLPAPGAIDEGRERDVMGVVALNFCNSGLPRKSVLICRLPGAPRQPKFALALDWSLSMAGQRAFLLDIVSSVGFEPPADGKPMLAAVRKGTRGWFPVANRYSLAPTELQMLQADVEKLHGEFDSVFIRLPDGVRRGGSFFRQILGVCDSALLVVGADATPRSWLAYARRCATEAGKPMMALVTGVSEKVVEREMESRK